MLTACETGMMMERSHIDPDYTVYTEGRSVGA